MGIWCGHDVGDRVIYQGDRLGTVVELIGTHWSPCGDMGCCSEYDFDGYRLSLDDGKQVELAQSCEVEDAPPNDPGLK